MKIIITGASGFIAQAVSSLLRAAGHDVWGLSRREAGSNTIAVDISDLDALRRTVGVDQVDAIIHLAAHIPQPENKADLALCQEANYNSTVSLLQLAHERGIKRLVYVSSLSMFDRSGLGLIDEDSVPSPATDYSISKLAGEYACRFSQDSWGMQVPILRLGTIYGPGMSSSRMIHFITEQCMHHEPVSVYHASTQLNVAHVDDAVRSISAMLTAVPQVYHLATESFTKRQLVLAIHAALRSRSALTFDTEEEVAVRQYTMRKLQEILGTNQTLIALECGIQDYATRIQS